jgi:hypothetical protein
MPPSVMEYLTSLMLENGKTKSFDLIGKLGWGMSCCEMWLD